MLLFFILYIYVLIFKLSSLCKSKVLYKQNTILFLENFPIENAGYQYRAAKWAECLNKNGYYCEVKTLFEDKKKFDNQFKNKNLSLFFIRSMKTRFKQCLYARNFQTVIVRRELLLFNDYGNLFMDKFLLKIHPNVILDFDDDIAAAKKQPKKITNLYGKIMLENGNKFNDSLRLYKRFIVGSNYLKQRILQENKEIEEKNTCVIPTCVDYDQFSSKVYDINNLHKEIVFGWLGGNHNLHLLDIIVESLNRIAETHTIKLIVVAGMNYENATAKFEIENQWWHLKTEKEQIKQFDIGVMPIEDNNVDRGKCGFKLIQYMGLGVVSVATNITINGEIIEDGINGFLVNSNNENWYEVLQKVISKYGEFNIIGEKARQTVINRYSFSANKQEYINFIEKCAE